MPDRSSATASPPTTTGRPPAGAGPRGLRAAALATAAAAVLLAAPAAAQPVRTSAPSPAARPADPAIASLAAELAELEQRRVAVAARLERLAVSLRAHPATPLVQDSLQLLLREHRALTTRRSVLEARARFREVETQLRYREMEAPRARAEVERAIAMPAGWFGVIVEETSTLQGSGRVLRAPAEYPRVLSVEPGSPAARAGLQAGDRLLAIDGQDLLASRVDLVRLLRPGRALPVRITRDGDARELTVNVTAKPRAFVSGVTVHVRESDEAPPGARGGRPQVTIERVPRPVDELVGVPGAPPPPSATTFFYPGPGVALFAGAEMRNLSPQLRMRLEVQGGVLVVQVARGSPAERAGVQQGDVVMRANGTVLTSTDAVRRVVAAAVVGGQDMVRLELVRDRKPRTIELRW